MIVFLFLLGFKIHTHFHFQKHNGNGISQSQQNFILNENDFHSKQIKVDQILCNANLNAENDFSDIGSVEIPSDKTSLVQCDNTPNNIIIAFTGKLVQDVKANGGTVKGLLYLHNSNFECTMNCFMNSGANTREGGQILHFTGNGINYSHSLSGTQFIECGVDAKYSSIWGNPAGPSLIHCEAESFDTFTGIKCRNNFPNIRAIATNNSKVKLSVQQSTFYNCTTNNRGAGIHILRSDDVSILDTTFQSCSDQEKNIGSGYGEGNALDYHGQNYKEGENHTLNVTHCNFIDCNTPRRNARSVILLDVGDFIFEDNFITFTNDSLVIPFLRIYRPGKYYINRNTFKNIFDIHNRASRDDDQFSLCIHYDGNQADYPVIPPEFEDFQMNDNVFDNITGQIEGRCMRLKLLRNNELVLRGNQVINCNIDSENDKNPSPQGLIFIRFATPTHGTFTFRDCLFENCRIEDSRKFASVLFIENPPPKGNPFDIDPQPYDLIIERCTFSHITSNQRGGALQFGGNHFTQYDPDNNWHAKTNLTLSHCTFQHNSTPEKGGAFCFIAVRPLTITNCIFSNNTGNQGAALYIQIYFDSQRPNYDTYLPNCTITHCTFLNNRDINSSINSVIYLYNLEKHQTETYITISDCTFQGNLNESTTDGYCINGEGKSFTILRNNFNNSKSDHPCGAIYIQRHHSILTIDGNDFLQCQPHAISYNPQNGGDENINITNCKFDSNTGSQDGIAISLDSLLSDKVYLSHLIFCNHYTNQSIVKLVFLDDQSNISLYDLDFTNNENNGSYGGASISVEGVETIIFGSCNFDSNSAQTQGGALHIETNNIIFIDCTFTNNSSPSQGGALYFGQNINIKLTSCTFNANKAETNGGAICVETGLLSFNLSDCIFINCTAAESSFISMNETTSKIVQIEVKRCNFSQLESGVNTSVHFLVKEDINFTFEYNIFDNLQCSGQYGGSGLKIDSNNPNTEFIGCSFINCKAESSQICVRSVYQDAHYKFKDCTFSYNRQETGIRNTRAVYIYDDIPVEFEHCHFKDYTQGDSGFAVTTGAINNFPIFKNCDFNELTGYSLIDCPKVVDVQLVGCRFNKCTFDPLENKQGTIIEAPSAKTITITNITFTEVTASNGAIKHNTEQEDVSIFIHDNEFTNCAGKSIFINAINAISNISSNNFSGCASSTIDIINSNEVNISNCIFTNNGHKQAQTDDNNAYVINVITTSTLNYHDNSIRYSENRYAGGLKTLAINADIRHSNFSNLHDNSALHSEPTDSGNSIEVIGCIFENLQGTYSTDKIKYSAFSIKSINAIFQHNIIRNCELPIVGESHGRKAQFFGIGKFDCSSITLDYCEFSQNKCSYVNITSSICGGGSGIVFESLNDLKISNSLFENNKANVSLSSSDLNIEGKGGGFYFNYQSSSLEIANCTFKSNTADREGGGIAIEKCTACLVRNCTFTSNKAGQQDFGNSTHNSKQGGALYFCTSGNSPDLTTYEVTNCSFDHNQGDGNGHALCISGNKAHVIVSGNCNFGSNAEKIGSQIIVTQNAKLSINESTISLDDQQYGHGIETLAGATIHVEGILFTNISTQEKTINDMKDGNAILIHQDSGTAEIINNEFSDCYRTDQNSFIISCYGPMNLDSNIFTFSENKGCGCVLVSYTGNEAIDIQIQNNQFLNVDNSGRSNSNTNSALYVHQTHSKTIIENNTFDQCDNIGNSPACFYLHMYDSEDLEFNDNHIQNNQPTSSYIGEVNIHNFGSDSTFRFDRNEFINNTFQQTIGGGAGLIIRNIELSDLTSPNETSSTIALYNLELTECQFIGNRASQKGGGIQIGTRKDTSNFNLVIQNCMFENNSASYGAAIAIQIIGTVLIDNCTFTDNVATNYGTIFFNPDEVKNDLVNVSESISVVNCYFEHNKGIRGQAIYYENGYSTFLHISNCTFLDNPNSGDLTNRLEISSTIFVLNTKYCIIENSIANCSESPQRGVYVEGGEYEIRSFLFINNHLLPKKEAMGRDGAAIFIASKSSHTLVSGCTFQNCSGVNHNYAIESRNHNLTVENNNFTFTNSYDDDSHPRGALTTSYSVLTFRNNFITNTNGNALNYAFEFNQIEKLIIEDNIFDNCKSNAKFNPNNNNPIGRALTLRCQKPSNLDFTNNTIQNCPSSTQITTAITFYQSETETFIFNFNSNRFLNIETIDNELGGGSGLLIFVLNFGKQLCIEMRDCVFDKSRTSNGNDQGHNGQGGAWQCGNYFDGNSIRTSFTSKTEPTFINCNFTNNIANNGGSLSLYLNNPISIQSCHFDNNTATMDGGAIHSPLDIGVSTEFNIEDCTFLNNTSQFTSSNEPEIGNAIHINGAKCTINNCHFCDNVYGSQKFSTISLTDSPQEVLTNTVIEFTDIANSCCSLYLRDKQEKCNLFANITNVTFIRSRYQPLDSDIQKQSNAIFMETGDSLYIDRCQFLNCGSNKSNSVIYDGAQSYCAINSSIIDFDEGEDSSRGFYSTIYSHICIQNTTFRKCAVAPYQNENQGGAFEYQPNEGDPRNEAIIIENCTFSNNSASYTSCIYLQPHSIPIFSRLIIEDHYSENFTFVIIFPVNLQSEVIFDNCTFRRNYYSKQTEQNCGGAGIWVAPQNVTSKSSWPLTFQGCTFEGNGCRYNGGAFSYGFGETLRYIYINITECRFIDNYCEGTRGGALYFNPSAPVLIERCYFSGNRAQGETQEGHCIYLSTRANGLIQDCEFEDNYAYIPDSAENKFTSGYSQVHLHSSRSIILARCHFRRSQLNHTSRGIDIDYPGSISILNCTFSDLNTSDLHGACIHYNTTDRSIFDDDIEVSGCTFSNNDAGNGCTLYLNLSNSPTIRKNTIINHRSGHYIFSIFYNSFLDSSTISECIFRNCSTEYEDGGGSGIWVANEEFISNGRPAELIFERCTWENNDAFDRGGALHYGKSKTLVGVSLTFELCEFTRNRGHNCGGALSLITKSPINIHRCTFNSNEVIKDSTEEATHGSSIFINSSTPFASITLCTFTNETADEGNAIYITHSVQTCYISDCTFQNCARNELKEGTIVLSEAQELLFENNTISFRRNACRGISIVTSAVSIIRQCNFDGCSSNLRGGCIFLENQIDSNDPEDITIEDCTFRDCDSSIAGCAMFLNVSTTPRIECISIIGITRTDSKSILELRTSDESMNEFTLDSCIFERNNLNNSAHQDGGGSGIFIARNITSNIDPYELTFRNCTWTLNTAIYGGAFSCGTDQLFNEIQLAFIDCTFDRNEADLDNGGALYLRTKRRITIERCTFTGNQCGKNVQNVESIARSGKGAITISPEASMTEPVVIIDTKILKSESKGETTGVYLGEKVQSVTIDNCEFISNSHHTFGWGSQLMCQSPGIEISRTIFDFDSTSKYGRHIYISQRSTMIISDCQFLNSNCQGYGNAKGGGIYIVTPSVASGGWANINQSLSLLSCTFSNCNATNGACFYAEGLSCSPTLQGNTIKNNFDPNVYKFTIIFESDNSYTIVSDCTFENNVFNPATQAGDKVDSGGTGLWIAMKEPANKTQVNNITTLRFENCKFINNSNPGTKGGALSYGYSHSLSNTALIFSQCIFQANQAASDCGALYLRSIQPIQITSCQFISNYVTNNGSPESSNIYIEPQANISVSISNTNFTGENTRSQFGSAIYIAKDTVKQLTVDHCQFTTGVTTGDKYAINAPVSNLIISNCKIEYTIVEVAGGGIYSEGCSSVSLRELSVSNCYIPNGKGAIHLSFSSNAPQSLQLDTITLKGCSSSVSAPQTRAEASTYCIYVDSLGVQARYLRNLRFEKCTCQNVVSLGYSKTVEAINFENNKFIECNCRSCFKLSNPTPQEDENYTLNIRDCDFTDTIQGNAFILGDEDKSEHANTTISNCNFVNNNANESKGGAFFLNTDYPIDISESHFADNQALQYGAMYLQSPNILIQKTVIYNNTATDKVGGLHITNLGELSIIETNITYNKSPVTPNLEIIQNSENEANIEDTYLVFTKSPDSSTDYNKEKAQIYIAGNAKGDIRIGSSFLAAFAATEDPISGRPIHIYSDFTGKLIIPEGNCIDASKEDSIYHKGTLETKDIIFNCNADGIVPEPTIPRTIAPTKSAVATPTASPLATNTPLATIDDGSSQSTDKELNIGMIAGIVVGIIVLAAIIVIVIILILRRKSDIPENSDNASEMNDEHIPQITGITDGDETPIWAGNDQDNNEIFNDDDGQMLHNDFEESWGDNVI